jgi:ComF family protein
MAIHRLKFAGWKDVGPALAAAMCSLDLPRAGAVTWVPLSRRRLAERGFDQAEVLARAMARRLELPVKRLLRRSSGSSSQARRTASERRRAMIGAFEALRSPPPQVLLVDDVLTTGSTAAACAEALRAAGARQVHLCTAVRALRRAPTASYTHPAGSRSGLWLPGDRPR